MFTLKELQGFADVGEHCGSVSGKPFVVNLDSSDELILANILAACNIASMESVDVIDNIYEFMLQGDSPFNVHYSDDDGNELVQPYDIKDSIWLVSIGECFIDTGIYRYCRITCASKNVMFRPDLILRTRIDEHRNPSFYTMDVKATGLLLQLSLKIRRIVRRGEEFRKVWERLQKEKPEEVARLEKLKRTNREEYFRELRKLFPQQVRIPNQTMKLDQQCWELGRQYKIARTEEERQAIRKELEEMVEKSFEAMVQEAQDRLETLQKQLEDMQKNKEEINKKRLEMFMRGFWKPQRPGNGGDGPEGGMPPPPPPDEPQEGEAEK